MCDATIVFDEVLVQTEDLTESFEKIWSLKLILFCIYLGFYVPLWLKQARGYNLKDLIVIGWSYFKNKTESFNKIWPLKWCLAKAIEK